MQNTKEKHNQKVSKFTQLILINLDGFAEESCETIFSIASLRSKPITQWMPFMESIFDSLLPLKVGSPEIRFAKIEIPAPFLSGYYDFTFSKVKLEDTEGILWCIFDYTDLYTKLMHFQQQHNELEIDRQLFELSNQKIKHSSEIRNRKLFDSYFNKKPSTNFYSKINDLLFTQKNIFDFFPILKNQRSSDSLADLELIIKEFGSIEYDYKNLLQVSLTDAPNFTSFNIEEMLQETCLSLEQKFQHSVQIKTSIQNSLDKRLLYDKTFMQQVFFNLFVVFLEQSKEAKLQIIISNYSLVEGKKMLVCQVSESKKLDNSDKIVNPTNLVLRLFMIKRIIRKYQGTISIVPSSSPILPFVIKLEFPCKELEEKESN